MAFKVALKTIQTGANAIAKKTSSGTRIADVASSVSKTTAKANNQIAKATQAAAGVVAAGVAGVAVYNDVKGGIEDVKNIGNGVGKGVTDVVPAVGGLVGGGGSGIGGGNFGGSLTYPETLKNISLNPAHINFQFYTRDTNSRSTSINLPMPNEVSNPNSISWDQEDFGMLGDTMVKSLTNIKAGTGSAEKIQNQLDAMAERMKSVAFYTGMSEIVRRGGGNNIDAGSLMGAVNGKALNPYKTMLFRGVNFRSFNFVFDLVPFSESDCQLIDNIITAFRSHSYPDYAADKMFFTYPDECQITYMWETGANKWLNNFKRAVCTNVEVNYAPMGHWSSLRNGFPNIIRINTSWTEVHIVTKGDIQNTDSRGQSS